MTRGARFALALALVAVPGIARAQWRGVRFEITRVGDSTFSFPAGGEKWIKAGQNGIAVDPAKRDALIARFKVTSVGDGQVTALVTGQVTNVRTEFVAILDEPRPAWYKQATFWVGLLTGSALGAGVALSR